MESIFLENTHSDKISQIKVHPCVLTSITDIFSGRSDAESQIEYGLLLGSIHGSTVVVTDCIGIVYKVVDQNIQLKQFVVDSCAKYYNRSKSDEVVVGSFQVQSFREEFFGPTSVILHGYFSGSAISPLKSINLIVDVSLASPSIKVYGFQLRRHTDKNLTHMSSFDPVPTRVVTDAATRVALTAMARAAHLFDTTHNYHDKEVFGSANTPSASTDDLKSSLTNLSSLIQDAKTYVDKVVSGEIVGDESIGRRLLDAVSSVPLLDATKGTASVDNTMKDALMVSYLSNLATIQLKIAERLNSV